ncbi:OmpA family protein [Actinoplanes sp. NPDC051851]|uniref:OmpA family protein n=1 Tax=Actinoplanes sp. NPDC051851 TaxID=3154753 RepID=UPI003441E05C
MKYRIRCLVATSALAATALAGCSESDPFAAEPVNMACPAQSGTAVTLVVGARANSPVPKLPDQVRALVREAAKKSAPIQVIRVDGVPTVALNATFKSTGKNDAIRGRELTGFLDQITGFVGRLQPKQPQADVLGALTLAAHGTPEGGTIVLLDSGIPTTGPLTFTNTEMFTVKPTEVADFLGTEKLVPDLTGRSVVLAGLGDTADPQEVLPENYHKQVTDLWTTVADRADAACVDALTSAPGRTAITTAVPVSVVALPKPPAFSDCGTTVLSDSSPVGFTSNTADYRDPDGAAATLKKLADRMKGHTQRVTLTGTTSSEGSEESNQDLSERRAAAVKTSLTDLGVESSRITAKGAGEHGPNRVRDTTKDGTLIPGAASRNRSVVVTLACGD